jgi:hypothetical protein
MVFAGPQTEIHEFIWGEITILKLPAHGRLDYVAMDVNLTNDSGDAKARAFKPRRT